MEALLLGIYAFFVWLIFIKLKWLPWNITSQVIVVIIPIVALSAMILALNVVAADTDAEAKRLFTTAQQSFVNLRRGRIGLIPAPIDDIEAYWEPHEKLGVENALACSVVGNPETVKRGIAAFADRHRPDELLLVANIFDHQARLRSFELAAEAMR